MNFNKSKYNLDYTLEVAWNKLKDLQPVEVCAFSGATYDEEAQEYHLDYLGKKVIITSAPLISCADKELTLQEQILIIHYLVGTGQELVDSELISYKELPGGEIYYTPFTNRAIRPLINIFGQQIDKLPQVAKLWGGKTESFAHSSISIPVFPEVTIYYLLWAGDDEFPPNATVLFPKSIVSYLNTEDVAVLVSQLVYQMPALLK